MKKCAQCGFAESDDAKFCSSCGSRSFYYESPTGQPYIQPRTEPQSQNDTMKYVLFAILTFFFPWIGGYFLIKNEVPSGYRNFAIVWCCLMALSSLWFTDDIFVGIIAFILCFFPVALYAFKRGSNNKAAKAEPQQQAPVDDDPLKGVDLETFADKELKDLEEKYSGM